MTHPEQLEPVFFEAAVIATFVSIVCAVIVTVQLIKAIRNWRGE